jgi:phosphoribosylanthranilate isomerase
MVLVKICGITNLEDALAATEAGADALGFNFYPPSARFVTPELARGIIDRLPPSVLSVGVFVNEGGPEVVERIASEAGVAAVQLHGDEPPAYCRALKDRLVIKALRVRRDFRPEDAVQYRTEAILLDAFCADVRGGTGRTFDWSLAQQTRELVPKLFLAGGLTPDNVRAAIEEVGPYAVDACSGVERSPGRKDASRMRAFVDAARRAHL